MCRLHELRRRCDKERGASATEYGLLAAAIAAVLVVIVYALGGVVSDLFTDSCEEIDRSARTGQCEETAEPEDG
jgi:pilus assembly protein Flp/PilA